MLYKFEHAKHACAIILFGCQDQSEHYFTTRLIELGSCSKPSSSGSKARHN